MSIQRGLRRVGGKFVCCGVRIDCDVPRKQFFCRGECGSRYSERDLMDVGELAKPLAHFGLGVYMEAGEKTTIRDLTDGTRSIRKKMEDRSLFQEAIEDTVQNAIKVALLEFKRTMLTEAKFTSSVSPQDLTTARAQLRAAQIVLRNANAAASEETVKGVFESLSILIGEAAVAVSEKK